MQWAFHARVRTFGAASASQPLGNRFPSVTASENKIERHSAIRHLLGAGLVANQDELRRKLVRRGFRVTQATLSRDIRELNLIKGSEGYALPGNSSPNGDHDEEDEDSLPALAELLVSFGLRVRQAQNLLVLITVMGSAQPVAAALDNEEMPEIVGTIAGDNTVMIVCPDARRATVLCAQLNRLIG
jgi:transcriptional regulator of arginine metabolism